MLVLYPFTVPYPVGLNTGMLQIHSKSLIKLHQPLHIIEAMASMQNSIMPCAACKILRRRCTPLCIFLPHFPPTSPQNFAAVHRVFGASNISKLLQEIGVDEREDAVTSLVYEANARVEDPVYGCVGLISCLQKQVLELQGQLDAALAQVMFLRNQYLAAALPTGPSVLASSPGNDIQEEKLNAFADQILMSGMPPETLDIQEQWLAGEITVPEPPADLWTWDCSFSWQ